MRMLVGTAGEGSRPNPLVLELHVRVLAGPATVNPHLSWGDSQARPVRGSVRQETEAKRGLSVSRAPLLLSVRTSKAARNDLTMGERQQSYASEPSSTCSPHRALREYAAVDRLNRTLMPQAPQSRPHDIYGRPSESTFIAERIIMQSSGLLREIDSKHHRRTAGYGRHRTQRGLEGLRAKSYEVTPALRARCSSVLRRSRERRGDRPELAENIWFDEISEKIFRRVCLFRSRPMLSKGKMNHVDCPSAADWCLVFIRVGVRISPPHIFLLSNQHPPAVRLAAVCTAVVCLCVHT